jgi:hypothetical protein
VKRERWVKWDRTVDFLFFFSYGRCGHEAPCRAHSDGFGAFAIFPGLVKSRNVLF